MPKFKLTFLKGSPEIEVPCALRARVYAGRLEAAANNFIKFADKNVAVKRALLSLHLLQSLAEILDQYVLPAIVAEVNCQEKRNEEFLKIEKAEERYEAILTVWEKTPKVLAEAQPLVPDVLDTVAGHFVRNLVNACGRIVADWQTLCPFFFPKRKVLELVRIDTSGSDFHKGGQQVLFLTFTLEPEAIKIDSIASITKKLSSVINKAPLEKVKLVYKPADLERDYRVVSDWKYVPSVVRDLGKNDATKSLLTIHESAKGSLLDHLSEATGVDLPRYRVLPCRTVSQTKDMSGAYGYVEFLPPLKQPPKDLQGYFTKYGILIAAAYVFGFTDIHHDNVVVREKGPHLIDLEMAFLGIEEHWMETSFSLLDDSVRHDAFVIAFDGSAATLKQLRSTYTPAVSNLGAEHSIVTMDHWDDMVSGFSVGMSAIRENGKTLSAWLQTMQNTIVRVIPEGTEFLQNTLRSLYDASVRRYSNDKYVAIETVKDLRQQCLIGDWSKMINVERAGAKNQTERWQSNVTKLVSELKERAQTLENFTAGTKEKSVSLGKDAIRQILAFSSCRTVAPWFCAWATGSIAENYIQADIPSYYQPLGDRNVYTCYGDPLDTKALDDMKEHKELESCFDWKWSSKTFLPFDLHSMLQDHLKLFCTDEAYYAYFLSKGPKPQGGKKKVVDKDNSNNVDKKNVVNKDEDSKDDNEIK